MHAPTGTHVYPKDIRFNNRVPFCLSFATLFSQQSLINSAPCVVEVFFFVTLMMIIPHFKVCLFSVEKGCYCGKALWAEFFAWFKNRLVIGTFWYFYHFNSCSKTQHTFPFFFLLQIKTLHLFSINQFIMLRSPIIYNTWQANTSCVYYFLLF